MPSKSLLFSLALLLATGGLKPAVAAEEVAPNAGSVTITSAGATDDGVITLQVETEPAPAGGDVLVPRAVPVPGQRVFIRRAVAAQGPDDPVQIDIVGDAVVAPIPMKKVAYLGVSTSPVAPALASQLKLAEGFGLTVDHLQAGEPGEKAGLKAHDVLVKFGDQKLVNAMQLGTLVRAQKPGDEVELTVIREGKEMKVKATLIEKEVPAFTVAPQPVDVIGFAPGEFGEPGVALPPIEFAPGDGPIQWAHKVGQGSMKYADGEHQLEITTDKDGRKLVAKDKDGKEVFSGPINTPEQRKAVPAAVLPKLEKLEKSTRFRMRRIAPGAFVQPGAGAIELELADPLDAEELKKMIEAQLKDLKLDGAEGKELNERIEEMKKQIDEMMKKTRLEHERLRGGFAPGIPAQPGEQRHEFKQTSATSMIQMNDGTHAITIKSDDKGKHVTVKDQDGKELFSGPLNTDEDRAKVPAELREKLERIEKSVKVGAKGAIGIFGGQAAPTEPAERKRAEKEEDR